MEAVRAAMSAIGIERSAAASASVQLSLVKELKMCKNCKRETSEECVAVPLAEIVKQHGGHVACVRGIHI